MFKRPSMVGLLIIAFFTLSACDEFNFNSPSDEPVTQSQTEEQSGGEEEITVPDTYLQKGAQGQDVESLQNALVALDYPIDLTGVFDDKTIWALTDLQFQAEGLDITGIYDKKTKLALEAQFHSDNPVTPGEGLPFEEAAETESGKTITGNPYEILVLVNKEHALPEDFLPEDLVIPDIPFPFTEDLPKKQMRKVAATAMEEMFEAAVQEGLELFAQSGFRSFERQEAIFAANVEKNGEEAANKYSARPGESEHQTGLTMDVTNADVGFDLVIEFGETPEGQWLEKHASEYGFIIRYPEGKEDITGYQYEPWHLRYVGEQAAKEITEKNLTLEEYLAG